MQVNVQENRKYTLKEFEMIWGTKTLSDKTESKDDGSGFHMIFVIYVFFYMKPWNVSELKR